MEYINKYSSGYFEPQCGFRIQLWVFEIMKDEESLIGVHENYYPLDIDYLKKRPEVFKLLVDYIRFETVFNSQIQFKFGLVIRN